MARDRRDIQIGGSEDDRLDNPSGGSEPPWWPWYVWDESTEPPTKLAGPFDDKSDAESERERLRELIRPRAK